MKKIIFLVCVLVFTIYLIVAAMEDFKTCKVTRWKHFIGGISAIGIYFLGIADNSITDYATVLAFFVIYIAIGYLGIYGIADGFVFANLVLFFGGIGGIAGIGSVIGIKVLAGFSFMTNHFLICMIKKKKMFQNIAGPFIPHILMGYISVAVGLYIAMAA